MYNIFRILIEVSDYSSSFVFFSKMKRKPSPPEEKIFRDNKRKYQKNDFRTCTEDVQNMYRRCTIYLEYINRSSGLQ